MGRLLRTGLTASAMWVSIWAATPLRAQTAGDKTTTSTDQKNDKADIKTTAAIRRALMRDKSLSVAAHNVTIVTRDGIVTLLGQVRSDAEKSKVDDAANAVAGNGKVTDNITVAAQK